MPRSYPTSMTKMHITRAENHTFIPSHSAINLIEVPIQWCRDGRQNFFAGV